MGRWQSILPGVLFAALLLPLSQPCSAALVITIGPNLTEVTKPSAGATTDVTLTVFAAADAGSESMLGYTIPVDIGPPLGTDMPAGISVSSATRRTQFAGQVTPPNFNPAEGDLLFIDGAFNAQPILVNTTPLPLFDFVLTIDSTVAEGTYQADIVRGALLSLDRNLTSTASFGAPAVIRVNAVPEPSVLGSCLTAFIACGLRRRR